MLLSSCGNKTLKETESFEQITLDNIPSSAEVKCTSEGVLETIEGNFVDFKINNEDDAFRVIASVSALMHCSDINSELRLDNVFKSPGNIIYRYKQYYKNLTVEGYSVSLFVNIKTNEVRRLKNAYVPDISLNTTPTFSEEDLKKLVSEKYKAEIEGEPKLEISFAYANVPSLVWGVDINNDMVYSIVVDAADGKVLDETVTKD